MHGSIVLVKLSLLCEVPRSHSGTQHSVGLLWGSDRAVVGIYLTTHKIHNRQTSMLSVGFEPAVPANERPQIHASDRAATGTGECTAILI